MHIYFKKTLNFTCMHVVMTTTPHIYTLRTYVCISTAIFLFSLIFVVDVVMVVAVVVGFVCTSFNEMLTKACYQLKYTLNAYTTK